MKSFACIDDLFDDFAQLVDLESEKHRDNDFDSRTQRLRFEMRD